MALLLFFFQNVKQSQPSKTAASYALEIATCHESMPKVPPKTPQVKEVEKKKQEVTQKKVEERSSKKVVVQEKIQEETNQKSPQEESQEQLTPTEPVSSLEQNTSIQISLQTQETQKTAQEEDAEFIQTNFAAIRAMALRNLTYPRIARKRGWEGDVSIQIELTARGEIANAFVVLSSGKEILDDAALEAVLMLRQEELPKPKRATTLTLPIHFALAQ